MDIHEIRPLNNQIISNQELSTSPITTLPPDPTYSSLETRANQIDTYDKLNQLFTEQDQQQKTVAEAREILGESAKNLTDSQVYDLVNEIQFLVDSWLEDYERSVFEGKTLTEVLNLDQK